jgi:hypothetical protein
LQNISVETTGTFPTLCKATLFAELSVADYQLRMIRNGYSMIRRVDISAVIRSLVTNGFNAALASCSVRPSAAAIA